MSEAFILGGQLLGTAFACGLNLYATVALLGVATRLDLVADLPPGMIGLENGVVIGAAAALYLVEVVVDRMPILDHAWEAAHTLIRPAAAGLLVALALHGLPWFILASAVAAAFLTALAAHGTKAGIRLIVSSRWIDEQGRFRPHRTGARTVVSLLEDVAAVAIVVAVLLYPGVAAFVLAACLLLLLLAGPRLWRAAFLGLRAVFARARGFFGHRGWRSRDELPRSVRSAVPIEPLGRSPARALPAVVTGIPHVGAYRYGWLVFTCDGPCFLYRSFFRLRTAPLRHISSVTIRRGVLTDTLEIRAGPNAAPARNGTGSATTAPDFTFYLLKDGPPPHVAAAELAPVNS
ncbi:hypothetical protein BH23GEM9_BH23GEM9_01370 [soil metagenome]